MGPARWIQLGLGAWLAAAAFLLSGSASAARVVDLADGLGLVLVALLAAPGSAAGFSAVVLGIWIMCAPAALAYESPLATMNAIAVGFAAIAVAVEPRLRAPARA
jgi:hypothetical protein